MIAPDGSQWEIPHERVNDAVKSGGKIGADVLGPDSKQWLIPVDRLHDALNSGGKLMGHFAPQVPTPAGLRTSDGETGAPVEDTDRGAMHGIERAGKALAMLPVAVYHSVIDKPRDASEEMLFSQGGPLMLAYKRLVVDPQIATKERGDAYAKSAEAKKNSGFKAEAENADDAINGDAHMARMMHFASLIPVLGPMSAALDERALKGDPSGASSEMLTQLATAATIHATGNAVGKLGPTTAKVGDVDVPVLASQTGSQGARFWEGVSKVIGRSGGKQLKAFAESQEDAAQEAATSVAKKGAESKVRNIQPTGGNPSASAQVAFAKSPAEVADAVEDASKSLAKGPKQAKLQAQADALRQFDKDFRESMSGGVKPRTAPLKAANGKTVVQPEPQLDGETWSTKLNRMGNDKLRAAFGGNSAHVAAIRNLAGVVQEGQNAAKLGIVAKFIQSGRAAGLFHHAGMVSGAEASSFIIGKVLTNAKATDVLANGLKVGASAPVIAQAVINSIQPEGEKKQQ
jgi:hypothetical protein